MPRILGIDPGTARLGYAILELGSDLNNIQILDCGIIETCKTNTDAQRLKEIREDMISIIKKYKPDFSAVEKLFFFKNLKTIVPVAQARGVILEALEFGGVKIFEYTPLEMKKIITGNGMAEKSFVSDCVHKSLEIETKIKPDDAVDAVGMALALIRAEGHVLATVSS